MSNKRDVAMQMRNFRDHGQKRRKSVKFVRILLVLELDYIRKCIRRDWTMQTNGGNEKSSASKAWKKIDRYIEESKESLSKNSTVISEIRVGAHVLVPSRLAIKTNDDFFELK